MDYYFDEDDKNTSPFNISNLTPIQMPNLDLNEIMEGRKQFTKEERIDVLIRGIGMDLTNLEYDVKWHLLLRMVPLVEMIIIYVNWDLVELESHICIKKFHQILF